MEEKIDKIKQAVKELLEYDKSITGVKINIIDGEPVVLLDLMARLID